MAKIHPLYAVLLAFSGVTFIAGLGIGINILINRGWHRVGHMTLLPASPVIATERTLAVPVDQWDSIPITEPGESYFSPPIRPVKPFSFDPDLSKYVKKCEAGCDVKKASFLYKDLCFYFTDTTYTFEECFEVCANHSPCYYFIYPRAPYAPVVKRNLRLDNGSVWTGAFKAVRGERGWQDIWTNPAPVVDVYDSHCSYMSYADLVPRSFYYCDLPRSCICGGPRNLESIKPIISPTTPASTG